MSKDQFDKMLRQAHVIQWSPSQGCFHSDMLSKVLMINRDVFLGKLSTDYLCIDVLSPDQDEFEALEGFLAEYDKKGEKPLLSLKVTRWVGKDLPFQPFVEIISGLSGHSLTGNILDMVEFDAWVKTLLPQGYPKRAFRKVREEAESFFMLCPKT